MAVRAIRGAITVEANTSENILEATKQLLAEILEKNNLSQDDVISVFFSCTKDLDAVYPAVAARQIGFSDTPLFCCNEMNVPGSLEKCLRIMLHANTGLPKGKIHHVYLEGAQTLRPDLIQVLQNGCSKQEV